MGSTKIPREESMKPDRLNSEAPNAGRRDFLRKVAAGAVSLSYLPWLPTLLQSEEKRLPNIVFLLIDDLGWMDLSSYGSELYETPAIDRLANEGMRFTQAYCAHPRCVPSRYSIMSGKYPARGGVPGKSSTLPLDEITMAEALKAGGYKTFFAGKWHLGGKGHSPEEQGFDVNIAGGKAGAPKSYFAPYNEARQPWHRKKAPIEGLDDAPDGEYLTDRLTDETIRFLENNKQNPFFVMLSHYAVHDPLQAKEETINKYEDKLKTMPQPDSPEFIREGSGATKMRQDDPTYAGMIQSMDESVGRIMAALQELGLEENTLVALTSDNGGLSNKGNKDRILATSNQPLRAGKGWCYEGGIRVPLIAKWPGIIQPGVESARMVTGTDYFPTFLQAAGLPLQNAQHLDGVSFLNTLKGNKAPGRKPLFWHSPVGRPQNTGDSNCTVIRDGDYKLIDWYDEERVELYHIPTDLREENNLAAKMPEKADELLKKITDWRNETQAYIKSKPAQKL